ncbi:hypothetical protein H4S07_000880 [Coemansia furcata]|uniref:Uncharacterized protein n=1 Tax=Coemansia furcata TaxID=417177 RepID=A0ACC1LR03_9FUNG|nr:hypothetical protein H4S07_000880 [Coemansia furcata]
MANDHYKDTESDRSCNCIFQLCSQLNLIDIGAQLEPANLLTNGHLMFTTKPLAKPPAINAKDIDRAEHIGYVSRIDLFLVPADLAERAAYSHRPTGCVHTSFDHDQISLMIWNLYMLASMKASAAKAVPNAMGFVSGIHLDYGILDNSATIDKINLAFAGADIPNLLKYAGLLEPQPQPQPFIAYKKSLVKIREIIYMNWSDNFGLGVTDVTALPDSGINMPLSRNTAAMDELFALHHGYLESLGTSPTAVMMAHTAAPIKQDEIDAACNRLVSHANPGPNGMPIKLFTSSEAACVVLCKLANYVLANPKLVTKDFVSGCNIIPYASSHPMSSLHVSHYNIEYRIITDILAH